MFHSDAPGTAAALAQEIWLSLWSTSTVPGLPRVTSCEQLQVDDLVLTLGAERYGVRLADLNARDAVREAGIRVWRVLSKGTKTVLVRRVAVPDGTWDRTPDLTRLGEPWWANAPVSQFYVHAAKRQIGRLGAMEELRKQVAAHGSFQEWKQAYAAAEAEEKQERAAAHAIWDKIAARRESRREVVKRLNEIAGDQLVSWQDFGGADGAGSLSGWLASKNRLHTYLLGLQAAKLITKEQYEEAERCVASLEQ